LQFALPVASGSRFTGDPRADRNPRSTSSIGAVFEAKMAGKARQCWSLSIAPFLPRARRYAGRKLVDEAIKLGLGVFSQFQSRKKTR
jgi:hypothetical protein